MTTATDRTTIRHLILDRHPELGFYATADSVASQSIIDLSEFGHTRFGADTFADLYIYRYFLTGNNRIKQADDLVASTGTLNHGGTPYTDDFSVKTYDIIGPLHPDELDACISRSLRYLRFFTHVPLTTFTDADMETALASNWTGSQATPTKVVTAANVYSGTQSLQVSLSGAGGFVRGSLLRVTPGQTLWTACLARADVGTVKLDLYDSTNGVTFGTAVSYSGEEFARLWRSDTVPAGCEELRVQLTGVGATDLFFVDSVFGPYRQGLARLPLPSYIDEQWKLHALRPAHYNQSIGSGLELANSRAFRGDWEQPQDFSIETFYREANPTQLLLQKPIPSTDMWLQAERPWSDVDSLGTETATTLAPLEAVLDMSCYEVFALLHVRQPDEMRWAEQLRVYEERAGLHELSRPAPPKTPMRFDVNVRA
jgi:hypothetical protein